ncbi:hypothetical protein ACFLTH_17125 [Bacteroidota bacterium]
MIELGGNITLGGFKDLDHAELIVVKKVVGSYARKMSDTLKDFENLTVTMKDVHKTPKSQKYELHAKLVAGGKAHTSEVVDRNLFIALDSSLKKVLATISKK